MKDADRAVHRLAMVSREVEKKARRVRRAIGNLDVAAVDQTAHPEAIDHVATARVVSAKVATATDEGRAGTLVPWIGPKAVPASPSENNSKLLSLAPGSV